MAKFTLFLVATLALAGCASAGMDELRARLAQRFEYGNQHQHHHHLPHHHQHHHHPHGSPQFGSPVVNYGSPSYGNGGYGNPGYGTGTGSGSGASAAASATTNGGYGNSGASASASAAATNSVPVYQPAPQYRLAPRFQPQYQAAPILQAPRPLTQTVYQPVYQRAPVYGNSGATAAASAAAGASGAGSSVATAAAGASGYGGSQAGAAAAAGGSTVQQSGYDVNYNPAPTNYMASTGTLANTGRNSESSAYKRATEDVQNVEHGHADDNHYYNAQSYGKAVDDNSHEAFADADEDVIQTPNMFRSKKKSTNYVNDKNHSLKESGSGVLAQDKHSSAYNKNFRKFNENVDQSNRREADGFVESNASASSSNFNDDDEMRYDSDGLGAYRGVNGGVNQGGAAAAAASSAVGGGVGGGVATSAALAGAH